MTTTDSRAPRLAVRTSATLPALFLGQLVMPIGDALAQGPVRARAKRTLSVDGRLFKDLNANGRLDPYEDWRRPVATRASDSATPW
jgi:hypothetical protein